MVSDDEKAEFQAKRKKLIDYRRGNLRELNRQYRATVKTCRAIHDEMAAAAADHHGHRRVHR